MSEQTETRTETLFLLWAARETGVLDALVADADTPAEVAAKTGITERAARLTVEALADEGFFAQVDGAYEPTNRALGFLAASDLRSVSRLPHELDVLDALRALPETMRRGEPPASGPDAADTTWNELGHVQATDAATVRACVTAAQHAISGTDATGRVLDLGGAPGTYAVEFATRGYDVTLLDTPERLAESESLLAHEPVETVAGEPTALDSEDAGATLPAVDCVFVPMRTHEFDTETNRDLVQRAHDVLTENDSGGWLVVVDHLRDRSPRATATTVTELATGEGACYTSDQYRAWFDGAGFRAVQVRDVPGTARQVVFGQARV
ncbi:methyltransferase domain-containing protein [Haloarchaeobius sp. TZWSO28]|uniref:methyltransferase domain-containing protein n=1 Tax=Haloarchaeobius sp. TZWSO28 TaxID=3446119 RepID=UPI003EC02089